MTCQPLRFGVNYTFSKNWFYSWTDWNRASITDDIQAIAALGFDHVRVQLLWPVFQPNENMVSPAALDRLAELLDICDTCGIDVQITVLTGWLSGAAYYPVWKGDGRNMFIEPEMVEAEKRLFWALIDRIGSHRRFMGFDLGNELSVLNYIKDPAVIAQGDAWQKDLLAYCESIAPGKFHINGVDHIPWFSDTLFSRNVLATAGAATSLHTWILFIGALDLYKPTDIGCVGLAEYCIEHAHAYATDLNRKVWIEEFGASNLWMPADQIPDFAEQTIRRAASCKNVWGFTWWCSHDIDRRFLGFDPLEYELGLLTVKNEPKPTAHRFSQIIKEFKSNPPQPINRPVALVFPDNLFSDKNQKQLAKANIGWNFAKPYMDLMTEGIRPAIVLESRSQDKEYLHARGITELYTIKC